MLVALSKNIRFNLCVSGCDICMFDHLCILFGSWKTGSYHSCKVTSNVQLVGHELYLKLLYTATLNVE